MRLLLLSNSAGSDEPYLEYSKPHIKSFLGSDSVKSLFVPYAAVSFSYDAYELKVRDKFRAFGHDIISIHHEKYPVDAVAQAEAIVIGGGNTFQLLKILQDLHLMDVLSNKVRNGTPYIGWSAGSNLACPTICTTNDMPVVETNGLKALNLIPFQINPHYTDYVQPGHGGESRDQRIEEYLMLNNTKTVVGLREGSIIFLEKERLKLLGEPGIKVFKHAEIPVELPASADISFLMKP